MVLEQSRTEPRNIGQIRHFKLNALRQLGLHIACAHKGREAAAKQAECQARGVLVGVHPDHQHAKQRSHQSTCAHARQKAQRVAARGGHGGKACNGGAQHHALGT